MKKIITLITMFVLSVGFLMAQSGFTYQAVVVDAQGNLVVNQQNVTANVAIKDANNVNFTQTIEGITTSVNGLAVFSIGDGLEGENLATFNSIDWKTAQIKVNYTVSETTMPTEQFEQVAAVPYALQSKAELSNDMLADYVQKATMQDYADILAAVQGNGNLYDQVLNAFIDSLKAHYDLAKEIVLSYIAAANQHDVDTIFEALTGNEEVMEALAEKAVAIWATEQGKEMIYDVLKAYAPQLTGDDVEGILAKVPIEVRDTIISRAVQYYLSLNVNYKNELIHNAVEEIAKYYINHISVSQVNQLMTAVENNDDIMDALQPKFNSWIDYYVDSVIKVYLNEKYYYCENGAVDLCAVQQALQTCIAFNTNQPTFTNYMENLYFYAGFNYVGSVQNLTATSLQIKIGNETKTFTTADILQNLVVINSETKNIEVSITYGFITDNFETINADNVEDIQSLDATLTLSGTCDNQTNTKSVTIKYLVQ
ncbi:MAG: hypothetical protein IJK22_09410 [Bacteroidales bacterium]|nr:hypothetical protein [Bacteroidales bacterium]